jgi:altronate dehydratase
VKSVLVISDRDNVATALVRLAPGTSLEVDGATLTVRDTIPSGHKVALTTIAAGNAVIKYGSPIGTASIDIPQGAHVHTHNVASNRGRGDLPPGEHVDGPVPRLAEPPDERAESIGMPALNGKDDD